MPYFALIIMFYHVKIACYQPTRAYKLPFFVGSVYDTCMLSELYFQDFCVIFL